jgi:hypothetical protein
MYTYLNCFVELVSVSTICIECRAVPVPVVAVAVCVPLQREAAPGSLSSRPGSTPGYWTAAAASAAAASPPAAWEG